MRQGLMVLFLFISNCTQAQTPKLVLPEGNTGVVSINVFSPDGTLLLTAGGDDRVCLWNVATGQLLSTLRSENGTKQVGFFKNSRRFYAMDYNYRLQIQDLENGKTQLYEFSTFEAPPVINEESSMYAKQLDDTILAVYNVTDQTELFVFNGLFDLYKMWKFTPDGRYLAAATTDSSIIFWDVTTGRQVYRLPALASSFIFSRDGKRVFTYNQKEAAIWEVAAGKRLCRLQGFEKYDYQADFSPDDSLLVTNHYQRSIVWETATGKMRSAYAHGKVNSGVVFTPNGKQLITSFQDHSSDLWDVATGKPVAVLKNSTGQLSATNFSKNGLFAAGGVSQSTIWGLSPLQQKRILQGRISAIRSVDFTRNAQKAVVTTGEGTVQVWDVEKGKLMHIFQGPKVESAPVLLSPDDETALFYWNDSAVQLYDLTSGMVKGVLDAKGVAVNAVFFSPDGSRVATLRSGDNSIGVWDVRNLKQLYRLNVKIEGAVADFSPDGRFMAISYADTVVQVLDAATGKLLTRLRGVEEPVFQLQFSPDGSRLLVSGSYGGIRIYATEGWKKVKTINMASRFPAYMNLSPDGKQLLLYNSQQKAYVYETVSGKQLCEVNDDMFNGEWSYFSADSKRVYLQHTENSISEYDCKTGQQLRTIELNGYYLRGFHPQKEMMVGMSNGEVRLVNMRNGQPLYNFFGFDGEEYLVIDDKGRFDGSDAAKKLLYMTCGTEIIALEQVKDLLYVPHIAERIMKGETINSMGLDAITICSQVPLVAAPVNTDHFIEYTITPQQGGLSDVALMVNAIEVKRYKKDELQQQGNSYVLKIEKEWVGRFYKAGETNEVQIKAYTGSNNLYARGVPVAETPAAVDRTPPNLFAVFIGVSDYKGETLDLGFAAKDADDLGRVFGTTAQKLLNTQPGEQHVFLYRLNTGTNRSGFPDKNTIKKTFEEIGSKAGPNDILLVFFAGHGVMQGQEQQFYFLTADAGPQQTDDEVQQTGISSAELMDWIQPLKVKAQKRILIFDACNSGQALKDFVTIGDANQQFTAARNDAEGKRIKVIEKLNERAGFFIYSASASSQSAYEYLPYQQGLLTYSLLKTIKENPSVLEGGQFLDLSKWLNASKDLLEALVQQLKRKQDPQLNSSATIHVGVVDDEVRKQIKLSEELPLFGRSEFRNSTMRVDNLNLRKTMDALLETTREVLFDKQYEGDEVYSLSGDYTITNGIMKVTMLLLKGGTTIVEEYNETGSPTEPNELCRKLMTRVLKRKL